MSNYLTPRDIAVALARNQRSNRIPFTAGQCFGLTINEAMSEACHFQTLPGVSAERSSTGSAGEAEPLSPPQSISEDSHHG